jgi:Flp pilus assembly protein TadG
MTVLAVVFFVIIMAVAGLLIDLGRLYNLHTQMQSYVDSVALAAAAELDSNSKALNRAAAAATGSVGAGSGGGAVTGGPHVTAVGNVTAGPSAFGVQKLEFYSTIASDPTPPAIAASGDDPGLVATYQNGTMSLAGGYTTAIANIRAKFVRVTVTPVQLTYIMLPLANAFFGSTLPSAQSVALQAVAGFEQQVCDNAPIAICNPYEHVGAGDFDPSNDIGKEIIAKQDAGGGPGNFGVLCPNGNDCRDMLGERNPNTQCVSTQLPGKPGNTTGPVEVGFNTRFDMYDPPFKENKEGADPEFAPAKNTTRGQVNFPSNKNCTNGQSDSSIPLPDDNCFMQSPTPGAGTGCGFLAGTSTKMGDGNWDRAAYWANNHPTHAQPAGYSTLSRYLVYLYELANQQVDEANEKGAPQCSSQAGATMRPGEDRRVLLAPIVNCGVDDQQIIAYGKFFMIQPLDSPWDTKQATGQADPNIKWGDADKTSLRLEIIGRVDPNAPDGILKQYPVLRR